MDIIISDLATEVSPLQKKSKNVSGYAAKANLLHQSVDVAEASQLEVHV